MFTDLLFECLSEELPYRTQNDIVFQCSNALIKKLQKYRIVYESVECFITVNRLIFHIHNISIDKLKSPVKEIKGPRLDSSEEVLDGFLRKFNKNQKDLLIRKIKEEEFYFLILTDDDGYSVERLFKGLVEDFLSNFRWAKSMRWGSLQTRWVRPIINILCLFNDKVLPIKFAGLTANNLTKGNKFMSDGRDIVVHSLSDYFDKLLSNSVFLNQNKRLEFMKKQIHDTASLHGLTCEDNMRVMKDLNGIVEWPTIIVGRLGEEFYDLPRELVLSVMHEQQHYLALYDGSQRLTHFVTVVNSKNDRVIRLHEKVLSARLTDAVFLIAQDKERDLSYYQDKLNDIVFHAKLGSVREKVSRITALSKAISLWIPNASLLKVERAAQLSKFDLSTSIVKEFPELQGIMGSYYAEHYGEEKEISRSISENYYPVTQEQSSSMHPISIAVSIADKIDSLVGFIAIGERATGSRDPFALRRTAISIVRLIMENSINIPIKIVIQKSVSLYCNFLFKKNTLNFEKRKISKDYIVDMVFDFLYERFVEILKRLGISIDIINSILLDRVSSFFVLKQKCVVLQEYLNTDRGEFIMSTYRRASNVVFKTKGLINLDFISKIKYSRKLLVAEEEIILADFIDSFYRKIKSIIKNNNFFQSLELLYQVSFFINDFIDKVRINDVPKFQKNRLIIMNNSCAIFNLVTNFHKISNI